MIVPTVRLIACYALAGPAITLLLTLRLITGPMAFAVAAFLVLAVILDAVAASQKLRGVTAALPDVTRLVKDRKSNLDVHIVNESMMAKHLRLALSLPAEIEAQPEVFDLELLRGTVSSVVSWPCLPYRRGLFTVGRCCLATASPLGLWEWRKRHSVTGAIHVYPGMVKEKALLAALFLNRSGLVMTHRRTYGKGREFERLRDYMAGDEYEDIHWKTTAKRRYPVSKVFQIEKTQEIYVVIDSSRLGGQLVPGTGDTKLDRFLTAALLVGVAATKQGDLFGLGAFSDTVHHFMAASGGKQHFNNCRRHIFDLNPATVNPDYEELFTFLRLRIPRRAMVMILTSLDDPVMAESFVRGVDLICRHHVVVAAVLNPPHAHPIFSQTLPDDGADRDKSADSYDQLSGHQSWHTLRSTKSLLGRRGVELAILDDSRFSIDLISRYMNVKERQRL
jgi:uncharacterized protein (DUF58 family)